MFTLLEVETRDQPFLSPAREIPQTLPSSVLVMICLISSQDIIGYRCVCVYKQTCLRLIILYITQDVALQVHKDGCCAVSGLQIYVEDTHVCVHSLHPTRLPQIPLLIYHPEPCPPEGHIPPGFL